MHFRFGFVAALALALWPLASYAQIPRAERPTYSVGDRWILRHGVYDLIRIENDLYIFIAEGGREYRLTKDLAVAKVVGGYGSVMEFDPPPRLTWPLVVGNSGSTISFWHTPSNPIGRRAFIDWKVVAFEDVQVAAGVFKAFRIVYSIQAGPQLKWWEFSVWYAPEVRQIVKQQVAWAKRHMLNLQVVDIDRPDLVPLQVALREPKDQTRVGQEEIVVVGKASSGKGLDRIAVTLNGMEISSQQERLASKKEVDLEVPVKLREGRNVLIVTAIDSAGETRQEARTLFYERPATALPARPPEPPKVAPKPTPVPPPQVITKPTAPPTPAETAPPAVVSLPPLQVTISSPRDQSRVENESIGLAGLVSGGKGISRVTVTLNGVELSRLEERTPQRSLAVNLPVKLRQGQNTLVVTATDADGATLQEVRTVHYEKATPLTVAFRYPEDRSRVTEETTVVAALVTSSKGINKVSVTLNGAEVHQQSERSPQKSLAVTVPVKLREGANAIVVSASEPDGNIQQEIRTVVYERPKVAEATAAAPPEKPVSRDLWAVIVGVGRYESREIPRLRYTVPDAEAIYEALIGSAGFKKEHVLLLTDKTEKKPTLRNLKWALGTFLARSAKKDDTVIIFFAGHGAPEIDQRGVERDGFSKYLVPSDAEPDDLYSTALPMDELQTIFARVEAERVVVFLDACYSGSAGGRTFASKKTRAGHVDDLFLERVTRSKGRAIITASRPSEVSIELPDLGHGIFTYYLLQALKGAADMNRDGIVSLQELYEYVEQQVSQKSRAVGGNQHPVMKGELEGVLPLVKVRGK